MKDGGDVDVFDLVIVLVRSGTDFNTSAQNVSKLSSVPFALKGLQYEFEIGLCLYVKSSIPLTVLGGEGDLLRGGLKHWIMDDNIEVIYKVALYLLHSRMFWNLVFTRNYEVGRFGRSVLGRGVMTPISGRT